MNPELEKEERMLKAAKKDPNEFSFFYGKYKDRVYSFIYLRILAESEAEDITQETFLKALQSIKKVEWRGVLLENWFLKIAQNNGIKCLRDRNRTRPVPDPVPLMEADPRGGPHENLERKEKERIIFKWLHSLDPQSRAIVVLRCFHEKSIKEIAEIVEISESNVKIRLFRARKRLRDMLE